MCRRMRKVSSGGSTLQFVSTCFYIIRDGSADKIIAPEPKNKKERILKTEIEPLVKDAGSAIP